MRILACASLAAALVLPACTRPAEPDAAGGGPGWARPPRRPPPPPPPPPPPRRPRRGRGRPRLVPAGALRDLRQAGRGDRRSRRWLGRAQDGRGGVAGPAERARGAAPPAAQVPGLASGVASIGDIDGESLTFCAVKTDGTLWCWGSNTAGQLGDGTMADRDTPMAGRGGA